MLSWSDLRLNFLKTTGEDSNFTPHNLTLQQDHGDLNDGTTADERLSFHLPRDWARANDV
jgi:hypothetical protein